MGAIEPVARAILAGGDPDHISDVGLILTNMTYAVIGQYAKGELDITAILERAVLRLTTDNESAASAAHARRTLQGGGDPASSGRLDQHDTADPGGA